MFSNFVDYFCCFSCLKRSHLSDSRPEDCSEEKSSQKIRAEANSIITKMLQNLAEKQAQRDTPLINETQLNKYAFSIVQSLLVKVKLEFKETQEIQKPDEPDASLILKRQIDEYGEDIKLDRTLLPHVNFTYNDDQPYVSAHVTKQHDFVQAFLEEFGNITKSH